LKEDLIKCFRVCPSNTEGRMAILRSCCCWRSVRTGSYASAIYTAVSSTHVVLITCSAVIVCASVEYDQTLEGNVFSKVQ
jgi:hypothetical protein